MTRDSLELRPYRSVLYMPGTNSRALTKAVDLATDALIFDLEDAVAPEAKVAARDAVQTACAQNNYGRRVRIIRVNAADTDWWGDDLAMAADVCPDIVLLPKVTHATDVAAARGRLGDSVALWAMVERPATILHIEAIAAAAADYQLNGFVMGTNDLAKELGASSVGGRASLMTALSMALLAARAHGLLAIDGVFNDIADRDGFEQECAQGATMGFDGKTLIHPDQLTIANEAYRPDAEALEQARNIITAFAAPENTGKGVLRIDGRMVEILHLEAAHRLVARAAAIDTAEA